MRKVQHRKALFRGHRGLPRGLSLAKLIGRTLDPMVQAHPPKLTIDQILAWADVHFASHGRWPVNRSGAIACAPGENWRKINSALLLGHRGLPRGLNLLQLFAQYRNPTTDAAPEPGDNRS